jgi:hypothetical protein
LCDRLSRLQATASWPGPVARCAFRRRDRRTDTVFGTIVHSCRSPSHNWGFASLNSIRRHHPCLPDLARTLLAAGFNKPKLSCTLLRSLRPHP